MNYLGMNIKLARTKKRLTQEEFAKLVGVSAKTVSEWESNKTSPNGYNLAQIAKKLKISLDVLIAEPTD